MPREKFGGQRADLERRKIPVQLEPRPTVAQVLWSVESLGDYNIGLVYGEGQYFDRVKQVTEGGIPTSVEVYDLPSGTEFSRKVRESLEEDNRILVLAGLGNWVRTGDQPLCFTSVIQGEERNKVVGLVWEPRGEAMTKTIVMESIRDGELPGEQALYAAKRMIEARATLFQMGLSDIIANPSGVFEIEKYGYKPASVLAYETRNIYSPRELLTQITANNQTEIEDLLIRGMKIQLAGWSLLHKNRFFHGDFKHHTGPNGGSANFGIDAFGMPQGTGLGKNIYKNIDTATPEQIQHLARLDVVAMLSGVMEDVHRSTNLTDESRRKLIARLASCLSSYSGRISSDGLFAKWEKARGATGKLSLIDEIEPETPIEADRIAQLRAETGHILPGNYRQLLLSQVMEMVVIN